MTSQIVSATIDEDFPIAGQDNDSQGFRDNFNIIKDGLATANSEITDLQNNVIIKSPIGDMALSDIDNNFNETLVYNVKTNRVYAKTYTQESQALTSINFLDGEYQTITVSGNHSLRFENWPDPTTPTPENVFAKIRLSLHTKGEEVPINAGSFVIGKEYTIETTGTTNFTLIGAANSTPGTEFVATGVGTGDGTAKQHLEITSFDSQGADLILKDFNFPVTIPANVEKYKIFEAWTADNGSTVFIKYIGKFA